MRQIDYSELFVEGRAIKSEYGDATLKCYNAGDLVVPTGKIVACDPAVSPETPPFATRIPPDKYPVILSVAHYGNDQRVACAMLKFGDGKPSRWGMALLPNQDLASLKEDEVYYYGVDSATGCFMDVAAAQVLVENIDSDIYFDKITEEMDKTYVDTWSWANICLNPSTGANIICFSTGLGDGAYTSYFGYDEKGRVLCLVTDFGLFEDKEISQ
jgi:hypothetical protein